HKVEQKLTGGLRRACWKQGRYVNGRHKHVGRYSVTTCELGKYRTPGSLVTRQPIVENPSTSPNSPFLPRRVSKPEPRRKVSIARADNVARLTVFPSIQYLPCTKV